MTSCENFNKSYYNYFLGQEDNLNNNEVFNYFDINYLQLESLPISYYSMNEVNIHNLKRLNDASKILVNDILIKINEIMDSKDNNYNNYNIYYITIILIIFILLIVMTFLRILQFKYPLYYIYILVCIIIILLLITSLWFLYVNTSLL